MVAGDVTLLGFVVFEHGEVDHPEKPVGLGIDKLLLLPYLKANCTQRLRHDFLTPRDD